MAYGFYSDVFYPSNDSKSILNRLSFVEQNLNIISDWYQSDASAKDYIKNKPGGYLETGNLIRNFNCQSESISHASADGKDIWTTISPRSFILPNHAPFFVEGQYYKIILDGDEYICQSKRIDNRTCYIGDISVTGNIHDGDSFSFPFYITYESGSSITFYIVGDYMHYVNIFECNYVKFDKKFLPMDEIVQAVIGELPNASEVSY